VSQINATGGSAITLDELIALNDEIAALVRAGVPLEPALGELSRDLPGRLGKFAALVAQRSSHGQSLAEVVSQQSGKLPPVYRAVIETGLKTGRLSAALEALAGSIRRTTQTRRSVAMAAIYPLMVLVVACCLFAFFAQYIAPRMLTLFGQFDVAGRDMYLQLARWGARAAAWGPGVVAVVFILAAVWWYYSGRAGVVEPRRAGWLLGWLPWMGQTLRWSNAATFSEVLALLVESRVPLDEALVLAAEASGSRSTLAAAKRMAAAIARGETGDVPTHIDKTSGKRAMGDSGFPPLLTWLMAAGRRHGALAPALKHAAETYRGRANHQAELARVFLPIVFTVGIAGTVTLLYALALFVPYTSLLKALGGP